MFLLVKLFCYWWWGFCSCPWSCVVFLASVCIKHFCMIHNWLINSLFIEECKFQFVLMDNVYWIGWYNQFIAFIFSLFSLYDFCAIGLILNSTTLVSWMIGKNLKTCEENSRVLYHILLLLLAYFVSGWIIEKTMSKTVDLWSLCFLFLLSLLFEIWLFLLPLDFADAEVVPVGSRVRLVNLPKKKNIHRDLKSAFGGIPGIIDIVPAVTGNKKTRDPICKGFAFVDFMHEEDAVRCVLSSYLNLVPASQEK